MSQQDSTLSPRESSRQLTRAWVRASSHVLNSAVEANRAALAAFGFPSDRSSVERSNSEVESDHRPGRGSDSRQESKPNHRPKPGSDPRPGPEADQRPELDWSSERTVESVDDLDVGDSVTFSKSISDEDVLAFARASGDTNPLHLSEGFASQTRFGGRIVHGTLVSGVVSAALARLPGVVIYLSQETEYLNPVEPGDRVTATVEVAEVLEEGRFRLSTVVTDGDDREVIEGEAVVLVDDAPDETPDAG